MIGLLRALQMAIHALRRNIMLSALSTLLIVIAIAAVIAMAEFGKGSSKAIAATIESMGADNLIVFPGSTASSSVSTGSGGAITLSSADVEAISDPDRCPSVLAIAPIVRVRTQIVSNNKNWPPNYIYGTTPDYLFVRKWTDMAEGEAFTNEDVAAMREDWLLGQTVVRELFDDENPLGKKVRINNKPFTVKGVLARKGASMMGTDQDDIVLAPWTTIKFKVAGQSASTVNQSIAVKTDSSQQVNSLNQMYPTVDSKLYPDRSAMQLADTPTLQRFINFDQLQIMTVTPQHCPQAIKEVTEVLRERHKLRGEQPDDFVIRDMSEISKALGSTSQTMAVWLLGAVGISLVVGGVGIMSIMLVSVTERTREIGLRMAVGARSKDIMRQFLVEAAVLCLLGGVIGVAVGRFISWCLRVIWKLPTEMSLPAILAAVGTSLAVGLVFGYYPAWKASRLDPIEALRYE